MDPKEAESLLVAIAQTRDRAAYARLFSHYAPRVKGYVIKRGVDGSAADELTQDVMAAVWTKARYFDAARGNASTWIFTVARNSFIDRIRREKRPELDPNDPSLVPPQGHLDTALDIARDSVALKAALAELPSEQAAVVAEVYGKGKSLAEVADETKTPLGTVKTRMRLALARLRTLMAKPTAPTSDPGDG